MNVTFACPKCDRPSRLPLDEKTAGLACSACGHRLAVADGVVHAERVQRCAVCSCDELYVRKDFSQRIGVTIILLGFIASTVTWYFYWRYATYAILFATALLDVLLYFVVGNVLQCYRCQSEFREVAGLNEHGHFRLEVHERYRQQAIRLQEAERAAANSSAGREQV